MEPGGAWERLLQTPTTWIVVAAVLFVIAVVLLVAGALAGRRARREQRAQARAAADGHALAPTSDDDPVTEPAAPGRGPSSIPVDEEDPVTEPAVPRTAAAATGAAPSPTPAPTSEPAARRLLGALVGDPEGALAGVAALDRGDEPGRAAVTLLRSGVPAPAVARLCGVADDDLGDLVATTLGVLPTEARSALGRAERREEAPVDAGEPSAPTPAPAG
jgi:hypothetical protein